MADDENCRSRPRTSASDDQAAQQGTPFKVQVGSKGVEHGFQGGMRTKSAVTEGGLSPNLLPPIQQLEYIAETTLCLATPRPSAINLVSGLPTS